MSVAGRIRESITARTDGTDRLVLVLHTVCGPNLTHTRALIANAGLRTLGTRGPDHDRQVVAAGPRAAWLALADALEQHTGVHVIDRVTAATAPVR